MEASNPFDRSTLEQAITRSMENYILCFPELGLLIEDLARCGETVLFGGSVRDQIHNVLHGQNLQPRDLDFVVDGTISFSRQGEKRNNFGGWRYTVDSELKIDYWELWGTYAFRKGFFDAAIENLPKTTVYTPNACVFDLQRKKLIDNRAVEDIARRVVAFNCQSYLDLFPDYQAFRAIDLAARLQYTLSTEVYQFVKSRLNTTPWNSFVAAVHTHRPEMSEQTLHELFRRYK